MARNQLLHSKRRVGRPVWLFGAYRMGSRGRGRWSTVSTLDRVREGTRRGKDCIQRYSSTLSQGFKDEELGNSPGWWANIEATFTTGLLNFQQKP